MADHQDRSAGPGGPGGCRYVISLRGRVGDSLREAFAPLRVTTCPGRTLLEGVLEDQAALYGVLARIQAFGLDLEEIRLAGGPPPPPGG